MRQKMAEAESGGQAEKEGVDSRIKKNNKASVEHEKNLQKMQDEVKQIEKLYGEARIDVERNDLVQSNVARLRRQAEFHGKRQSQLQQELQREEELKTSIKKECNETKKRFQELELQVKEHEQRLEKKFSSNISPEEVIALRQTCARQLKEIVKLQSARPLGQLSAGPSEGISARSADLSSCWKRLQEIQTNLLHQQSSTSLIDLSGEDPQKQILEQQERLDSITQESSELSGSIRGLLRDVAGIDDQNGGFGTQFASVAMTRHLKATKASKSRGPMAKIVVPVTDSKYKTPLSLPVMADLKHIQSLHGALL